MVRAPSGIHTMNIFIPSILLSMGGKCLLNWALVFFQRNCICRSFVGVFSVSLAVVDTALTLLFTTIHIHSNGHIFLLGLHLTRYHICLLLQILEQVYNALQWPVVVIAGLNHFCTVSQRLQPAGSMARWIIYLFVTILLWYLAAFYIFLLSDFIPVLEDVPYQQMHQCWIICSSQILQVATLLLLTLGCAALYTGYTTRLLKSPPVEDQITDQSGMHSRRSIVCQALNILVNTWTPFFIFLAVLLLLPVPSYLGLNVAWLCFLNSFLIGTVLCVVCPTSQLAQGLAAVPHDSFCEWRFKFSLAAKDECAK
uniref:G-protein coupled receptors family 1 profile domain-containing protein n=1 Tax=Monopterus albus TaxID=43700 RepID=A0A3Q3KDS1_MONAL|nr:probable G-protein coupled receptor 160 [Monopterus albus]XP_020447061.1 probable G-protein coupled receptor 160 [Monopterus albus]XP_020447062.1 probable G-protein coupled receptor 160 [Monopterus albus]XP_020447063.1 probable G-protein coupled receptor 160 [Monopterus albus]XP_020447064.1 probable G-protein coupled receptor 160 [Monopterus albus]XP_020447065.1 probable G-protein coupled receptor 160 [Monopterus albus]XP_020447066.1 probable G-protein coupled receptor 160 [Monopterus albu